MVFSSNIFIFFFLPITLTGYFMLRSVKSRNLWLLFMSCFFYIFGGAVFFPIIVYTVLLNYAGGCLLACARAPCEGDVRVRQGGRCLADMFLQALSC